MGTVAHGYEDDDEEERAVISLLKDLKVSVHHSSLVFPSQETHMMRSNSKSSSSSSSLFLSNIDQVLNLDVQTVHFFPPNKDYFPDPQSVAQKLKESFAKVLVPYDFLAGRLKLNGDTGRLEIDCNAQGAGFVVASTEYALDDIGDLVYPNPAFAQLVCTTMHMQQDHHHNHHRDQHNLATRPPDHPLCILQVTTFKCGGFAMGISNNHATFDGVSFRLFLDNLAALAADKPLPLYPFNDRRILAARSPPRVTFPHPELQPAAAATGLLGRQLHDYEEDDHELATRDLNPSTVFEATQQELDFNIFRLSPHDLSRLKEKAKSAATSATTSFNVVTALIWRCKALSSSDDRDLHNIDIVNTSKSSTSTSSSRESTVLYAVDIRRRLKPALPKGYTGNAVLTAYAWAECKELEKGPFSRIVEMVGEGAARMTDEYVRSVIDWGELHKGGFPRGEVLVSSWSRLGFADVEYPWGKPRYSCPVVYHSKDIILLFPDQQATTITTTTTRTTNADGGGGGTTNTRDGVNILVALPSIEMNKFQTLFHDFLSE